MNVLMVHGVNTNEDANPNPYDVWSTAIIAGLQGAGYKNSISADPDKNGVRYNALFDKHSDNPAVYAAAVSELMATWAWHTVFGVQAPQLVTAPQQPSDGLRNEVRWTAGMVAQWVVEDGLRSDCHNLLYKAITKVEPDIIFAHSLGSVLCYDFFVNDKRGKNLFNDGTLVTFGSQIGNPFVKDRMWNGQVKMINARKWYHLYNPYDHVFVAPLDIADDNFHQFIMHPPFGTGSWFNFDAHQVTKGDGQNGDNYPGYLDNATTNGNLWPALIPNTTTASLIEKNVRVMKLANKKFTAPGELSKSRPASSRKRKEWNH
jgi:metacaspase-1